MNRVFIPKDVSNYRQALMGLALLGVMSSHWFGFQGISSGTAFRVVSLFAKLVFTEGLLFLSGYGLYYSFSRDTNIGLFYRRRLFRLYIPFFLLSFPLYTYWFLVDNGYTFSYFLQQITTVYFWTHGNYGGMWYVSISLVLYLFFPFFYKYVFSSDKPNGVLVRGGALLVFVIAAEVLLSGISPTYFDTVSIGVTKIPMFLFGMVFGFLEKNNYLSIKRYCYLIASIAVLYLTLSLLKGNNQWLRYACGWSQKLFFIPLVCGLFSITEHVFHSGVVGFFNWFGKYSLELYIIHLHLFMLLDKSSVSSLLSQRWIATIAIGLAIILCVPVNRLISYLIGRIQALSGCNNQGPRE